MERSEPDLAPEWLRSNGGGGLSHHFVSSQAGRKCSSNYRRSSSSNGNSNRHDRNPYSRSYNSSTRNQHTQDREKLGVDDTWGLEYSDPLTRFTGRKFEKSSLGRSKSMISGRAVDSLERTTFADLRNRTHNIHSNGKEASSGRNGSTGTQGSFEIDFPLLGSDERPTTPDIIRIPSPGLSRGVQGLSIGSSCLVGSEGWTSALAEVPIGAVGINSIGSPSGLQQASGAGNGPSVPASASTLSAVALNDFNMGEPLVQTPGRSLSIPPQSAQPQKVEELPYVGNMKLIPMTASKPKIMVLNQSDKLKPKTAARSNEGVIGPKNGVHQMSSLQLGNQAVRGGNTLAEIPKSSGMSLLKPAREKAVSPAMKDIPVAGANGPSTGVPSPLSVPFKNPNNVKFPMTERRASAYSLNAVPVVDKRLSLAQLRSRNDFLALMRKKSMASSSADADSGTVVSSGLQKSDESKETASGLMSPAEDGEEKCDGDACSIAKSCSDQGESALSHSEIIHPAEELDFLRALGWKDDEGDDEGLTQEEINAFVTKYMTSKPAAKLPRGLQLMVTAEPDSQGQCTTADASSKLCTSEM